MDEGPHRENDPIGGISDGNGESSDLKAIRRDIDKA